MRALVLALCVAACSASGEESADADGWRTIDVQARRVELGAETVGEARYAGGLVLSSDDPLFGGWSGLEVVDGGDRLVAISDAGAWLSATLVFDAAGNLTGLEEPRVARMRDENGEVFASKADGDAEGLAQLPDGRFAVSFEQSQSIRIYDLNVDGPTAAARRGPALAGVEHLPPNQGLEALASDANGDLIAGAEGGWNSTPIWLAPLQSAEPVAPLTRYRQRFGFSLVGMDRLPNGDFIALERAYAPGLGARARLMRFAHDALRADESIEAVEIARLAPPMATDNFEGVAAVAHGDGVHVYIISDDNFSARQRTLLYAFDVPAR